MQQFIIDLVVIIGLPWLVRTGFSFLFGGAKQPEVKTPDGHLAYQHHLQQQWHQKRRHWTQIILWSTIFYCVYFGFMNPLEQNLFELLNLPTTAPNFLVRNQLRQLLEENPEWTEPQSGIVLPRMPTAGNQDGGSVYQSDDEDGVFSVADQLTTLYELLKSGSNRFQYLTFGQEAFIYCRWCRSDYEYLLYMLPSVLVQYLVFMAVVLIATELVPSKRPARPWLLGVLASCLFSELSAYMLPQEYMIELFGVKFPDTHTWLRQWRYSVFLLFALIVLIYNRKSPSEKDIFQAILSEQDQTYARIKFMQLQQMAIQSDGDLMKQHAHNHRQMYNGQGSSEQNSDVSGSNDKDKKPDLVSPHDMTDILQRLGRKREDMPANDEDGTHLKKC